jgi:hypothetical protein
MLTVPSTGGAVKAKLVGGTLPYTITGIPNIAVATVSLSTDTLTVTPVGPGSTTVEVTDSLGFALDRVVVIGITVSGGGGGGAWGSGRATATSSAGNLDLSGAGVWPAGAGPSVVAVFDTVDLSFVILAYQRASGANYNYILLGMLTPSGPATGTFTVGQTGYFQVGFNADTANTDTSAYTGFSGSLTISSVNGSNVQGSFTGQALKVNPPPISMSGTFDVTFVRGRAPVQIGDAAQRSLSGDPEMRRTRLR